MRTLSIAGTGFLLYDGCGCDLSNTTPNFTPNGLASQRWGVFLFGSLWAHLTNFQNTFCAQLTNFSVLFSQLQFSPSYTAQKLRGFIVEYAERVISAWVFALEELIFEGKKREKDTDWNVLYRAFSCPVEDFSETGIQNRYKGDFQAFFRPVLSLI